MKMQYLIFTSGPAIGQIHPWLGDNPPENTLVCDGDWIKKDMELDLYQVIGDTFAPKYIKRKPTFFEKIKMLFVEVDLQEPNPCYVEGYFKLPDLRSEFLGIR